MSLLEDSRCKATKAYRQKKVAKFLRDLCNEHLIGANGTNLSGGQGRSLTCRERPAV